MLSFNVGRSFFGQIKIILLQMTAQANIISLPVFYSSNKLKESPVRRNENVSGSREC